MTNYLQDNLDNKYKLKRNSDEDETCILKFSSCDDNKYQMYNLNIRELKEFIKFAKKVENMQWKDIRRDRGLNYESLKGLKNPLYLSEDVVLHSMRLSKKFRIIGYKDKNMFYIIWFDNNHETC